MQQRGKPENLGQCPFLKQTCTWDRCALWVSFDYAAPAALDGMVRRGHFNGCMFSALLFVMSQSQEIRR